MKSVVACGGCALGTKTVLDVWLSAQRDDLLDFIHSLESRVHRVVCSNGGSLSEHDARRVMRALNSLCTPTRSKSML